MKFIYSPISVDLGAKNTGVFDYVSEDGNIICSNAFLIRIDDSFNTQQVDRRLKRHQRRNIKRNKFAKKFAAEILKYYGCNLNGVITEFKPNIKIKEYLGSIINRRGYTFLSTDEKIDEIDIETDLKVCSLLEINENDTFDDYINNITDCDYPENKLNEIIGKLNKAKEDKKLKSDEIKPFITLLNAYISSLKTGAVSRRKYLQFLKDELQQRGHLIKVTIKNYQLANLIGNISNLQLRDLRKYFNLKFDDKVDDDKILKILKKANNTKFEAKKYTSGLKCLIETDSIKTNPGYEDENHKVPRFEEQNNRRPPKCPAIRFNSKHKLFNLFSNNNLTILKNEAIKIWFNKTNALDDNIPPLDIIQMIFDANPQVGCGIRDFLNKNKNKNATIESIKTALNSNTNFQMFCQLCEDSQIKIDDLLTVAQKYSEEINFITETGSLPKDSILKICLKHPTLKKNTAGELAAHTLMLEEPVDKELFFYEVKKNKLGTAFKNIADAIKNYRSGIKYALDSPPEEKDKEIKKLNKQIEKISFFLDEFVETENYDPKPLHRDPFIISQLYHLLIEGTGGFNKNCTICSKLNFSRKMNKIRQLSRSDREFHKPFDGMVGRLIDRLAWELAKIKMESLKKNNLETDFDIEIPIIFEANSFKFSEELADKKKNKTKILKKLDLRRDRNNDVFLKKEERIKSDSKGICPYCGKTLGDDGEIDHIIPRASNLQNAEFNLIYVHSHCNREKLDRNYNFNNIHESFLKKQGFNSIKEVTRKLTIHVDNLKKREYTNELERNSDLRVLCRLGLFHPEFSSQFRWLLAGRKVASVNGTQKYLKAEFIKKLNKLLDDFGHKGNRIFSSIEVPSQRVSESRRKLCEKNLKLPKKVSGEAQSAYSHCLDATIAAFLDEPTYGGDFHSDLPTSLKIIAVTSKKKYERLASEPKAAKHFKDTLYAENFVPVIMNKLGDFFLGFTKNNSYNLPDDKIPDLLFPVLKGKDKFENWQQMKENAINELSKSNRHFQSFVIDKKCYSKYVFQQFHEKNCSENIVNSLNVANQIRYFTTKKNVASIIENKKKIKTEIKINVKKNQECGLLNPIKINLKAPFANEWKNVNKLVAQKLKNDKNVTIEKINKIFKPLFMNKPTAKLPIYKNNHERMRTIFSLPVIDSPSGAVRLKRENVFQIIGQANGLFAGINPSNLEPVLIPFYALKSKNIMPVDPANYSENCIKVGYKAPILIPDNYEIIKEAKSEVSADKGRWIMHIVFDINKLNYILPVNNTFKIKPSINLLDEFKNPKILKAEKKHKDFLERCSELSKNKKHKIWIKNIKEKNNKKFKYYMDSYKKIAKKNFPLQWKKYIPEILGIPRDLKVSIDFFNNDIIKLHYILNSTSETLKKELVSFWRENSK